ncbi:hypothetical protein NDN16_20790, partial [Aureimonas altamirensis]|uniref:hypothetical protein n=1 Tax=Aureimonas altamirensis TaxID=370622 RepID=UPI002036E346
YGQHTVKPESLRQAPKTALPVNRYKICAKSKAGRQDKCPDQPLESGTISTRYSFDDDRPCHKLVSRIEVAKNLAPIMCSN